ncbi:Fe2OG dioxygenase domain-containing protein [Mycena indigotica]|uniref:Fe2OG dioxygenase domain-containing protein n=1 Tax=Mycena indigotica TaxID=2126181 RepID=A0A8H6S1H2_9AGAR|nr:Fe2OG dioxygenase domain-containing protein [Mycena indigotica]KAF7291184.1 Fe2OG dioxygenase domain-containing protein [Mycena indigotica]
MPGTWTAAEHIGLLKESLQASIPYTSGVQRVRKEDLGVFYRGPVELGYIDFNAPSEQELVRLAEACQKATFGAENGDVLDETYRKAGKMDVKNFAARLDLASTGILDAIAPDLLIGYEADEDESVLRAEMYKLNVYGPGSFFKAHQDTPRAANMIGSLVVVLPTDHEGGMLTLSQDGSTWIFDSARQLEAHRDSPMVAYIAFFSDVTHTVEPVVSGYRVTLTYNLFLTPRSATGPNNRLVPPPEQACETSLRALLADPKWFPKGGHLAFGLTHQYPMPHPQKPSDNDDDDDEMYVDSDSDSERGPEKSRVTGPLLDTALLKGCDARLRNAAVRAGLMPRIRLVYRTRELRHNGERRSTLVVMDQQATLRTVATPYDDGPDVDTEIERQGTLLTEVGPEGRRTATKTKTPDQGSRRTELVHWVTPRGRQNRAESGFGGYMGNEYGQGCVYGDAELFIRIPKVGEEGR